MVVVVVLGVVRDRGEIPPRTAIEYRRRRTVLAVVVVFVFGRQRRVAVVARRCIVARSVKA